MLYHLKSGQVYTTVNLDRPCPWFEINAGLESGWIWFYPKADQNLRKNAQALKQPQFNTVSHSLASISKSGFCTLTVNLVSRLKTVGKNKSQGDIPAWGGRYSCWLAVSLTALAEAGAGAVLALGPQVLVGFAAQRWSPGSRYPWGVWCCHPERNTAWAQPWTNITSSRTASL